jgi:cytochrome c peroxidase
MAAFLVSATSFLFLLAAASGAAAQVPADLQQRAQAVFGTLPAVAESRDNPLTEAKITLGRALYFDPRLSASNTISCNSCHQLDRFGVDGEPTSPGHKGERGERNSPTVYNAAFHFVQFWDGRAATIEEQAKGPILNPVEMGMSGDAAVIDKLRAIPGYRPLFAAAFPKQPEPITYDNIALAIGAFERKLVTPAPFDRYLAGDTSALTEQQQLGLAKFMDSGCIVCHTGPLLGGSMYQKLGLVKPYPTKDPGRAKVTNSPADQNIFKVPSLRNVAQTGPYFHDGGLKTLPETVRVMGEYQLGRQLSNQDVELIITFLGSLTGTVDTAYTAAPKLPQ